MYRLLVVDDEQLIVDGICDLFMTDTDLDVKKAMCGKEALDIAENTKIDVLITDIRMPDINGIDLYENILEIWPHCRGIFLTGYDDFKYIQKSLRLGAVDYIIKTEGDSVILDSVRKCISLIENEAQNEEMRKKIKCDMETAMPALQNHFLRDILEGNFTDFKTLKTHLEELYIELDPTQQVLLLIAQVSSWHEDETPMKKMEDLYGIREVANGYIRHVGNFVSVFNEGHRIVWIIQTKESRHDTISYIYQIMDNIQGTCKSTFGVLISMILNNAYAEWDEISENYHMMSFAQDRANHAKHGVLMLYKEGNEYVDTSRYQDKRQEDKIRTQIKKSSHLSVFLHNNQKKEYFCLLNSIFDIITNSKCISYEMLTEAYYSIATCILSFINKMQIKTYVSEKINLDLLINLGQHSTWSASVSYIKELSEIVFRQMESKAKKDNANLISSIDNYIMNHISEDLSVSSIAKEFNYNADYLSRIYKEVTEKSLRKQISVVRINMAIELLGDDALKIQKISEKLGFASPSYFSIFFKKHMDVSPQEYRDISIKR